MKRILVSGANKGIGYAIAKGILEQNCMVFLGSRDLTRGQIAAEKLARNHNPNNIETVELDVASDKSVTTAATHIQRRCNEQPLYGIVNNAGIGLQSDDLNTVLNVNTCGIQRVCNAMIPLLQKHGRIVNVTSAAGPNFVSRCSLHYQNFFSREDITWNQIKTLMTTCIELAGNKNAFQKQGLADGSPYGLSKACANALNTYLARQNPNLIINACTPGYVATDMTVGPNYKGTMPPAGMKTPNQGAKTPLFLLFGNLPGSGHYYGSDAKRSPLDRYRAPGTRPYDGN